jgi:hypothetical protein
MGKKTTEERIAEENAKYRTKQERQFEVLNIIYQLKQNDLTSRDPEVRELLEIMNDYVVTGERKEVRIPFPRIEKTFKGVLATHKGEKCVLMMKHTPQ